MQIYRTISRLALLAVMMCSLATARLSLADDPDPAKEKELIAVLQKGEKADKALACKQLAIHGSKAAVPELAKLLADPELNSWTRIALEAIPDAAADEALRDAIASLQGLPLVGTINSLGVRRSAVAVEPLIARLKDADAEVASAAAVALGKIGNPAATAALRGALAAAPDNVRGAVAEGCILTAEQLLAGGKGADAAAIYDEVRAADVPKPRKLDATRGAILARNADGIPLLLEQLRSPDKGYFQIGLCVARELPGQPVADALAAELSRTTPDRAALVLYALADRKDAAVSPAVLAAAKAGEKESRVAAIGLVGRAGDAASLPTLLEAIADADRDVVSAAKSALATLPGEKVNAELVALVDKADGKSLPALIAVIGERRVEATPSLVKALNHADATIRTAALNALGETVSAKDLAVLVSQVISPKNKEDAAVAFKALKTASVRMPDREVCAAELASALPQANSETKANLLNILGSVGGTKSLHTIAAAMKAGDETVQDSGSKVLGEWMTADAGPVLLDLAKTSSGDKYRVRALRGYIRIARQFQMPVAERAVMCQKALEAAGRPEERQLVLAVLERYPAMETLKIAIDAAKDPALKDDAGASAQVITQKIGNDNAEAKALLATIGLEPAALEIIKCEYGAGASQRDVTDLVRKYFRGTKEIKLPSDNYNEAFGGDPAANLPKQLKIQYRMGSKSGEVALPENAPIVLPPLK